MELRSQSSTNAIGLYAATRLAGFTMFEVVLGGALLVVLSGFTLPPLVRTLQQYSTRVAAAEVAALYTEARLYALSHGWDGGVEVMGEDNQLQLLVWGVVRREYVLSAQIALLPVPLYTGLSADGAVRGDRVAELLHPFGTARITIQEGGVTVQ